MNLDPKEIFAMKKLAFNAKGKPVGCFFYKERGFNRIAPTRKYWSGFGAQRTVVDFS